MQTLRTLVRLSTLALLLVSAASQAATVANFDFLLVVDATGGGLEPGSSAVATGIATLDDNGTLSAVGQYDLLQITNGGADIADISIDFIFSIQGVWSNPTLTDPTGGADFTACTDNGSTIVNACGNFGPGSSLPSFYEGPINFDLSVGGETSFVLDGGVGPTVTLTTLSEVPVPSAAFLFGSALVGLAGLRRKK